MALRTRTIDQGPVARDAIAVEAVGALAELAQSWTVENAETTTKAAYTANPPTKNRQRVKLRG